MLRRQPQPGLNPDYPGVICLYRLSEIDSRKFEVLSLLKQKHGGIVLKVDRDAVERIVTTVKVKPLLAIRKLDREFSGDGVASHGPKSTTGMPL